MKKEKKKLTIKQRLVLSLSTAICLYIGIWASGFMQEHLGNTLVGSLYCLINGSGNLNDVLILGLELGLLIILFIVVRWLFKKFKLV